MTPRRSRSLRFLTVDEVVSIHEEAIDRYGGSLGVRDAGLLDAAVHAPQATFGGEFLYPSLLDKAAVYLIHIAANHPFMDGNKRTAWVAARTFLLLNGIRMKPRWREIVDLVEAIADGRIREWTRVSAWMSGHIP